MKTIAIKSTTFLVLISMLSCKQMSKDTNNKQSFSEQTATAHHSTALEVLTASKTWITNFNSSNTKACLAGYDEKATMSAMPFGIKKGVTAISEFWTPFIKSGATNLVYTNVSIEVVDQATAFLSANFSMNVGKGIIHQEKWEKKAGKWLLTYDDFQVTEQFSKPKENSTSPIASHLVLEELIQASSEWIKGFNAKKEAVCGNAYSENATMNAVPFLTANGKQTIQNFWGKLIKDGAENLIYHNPTFKDHGNNTVSISSQWSMSIGEGKIYQEKWEKIAGKWLISYDEFKVLKQYK